MTALWALKNELRIDPVFPLIYFNYQFLHILDVHSLQSFGDEDRVRIVIKRQYKAIQVPVDILTFLGGVGLTYYYSLGDNGNSAGSTLSKGEWIYPFVHGNSGDVDKIQLFLNLSPL